MNHSDSTTGVTIGVKAKPLAMQQFPHVAAGMHIGPMTTSLPAGRFGAVLTVALKPGSESNRVHHRHIPLSYAIMDQSKLMEAVTWTLDQLAADRSVLVRSERGRQRPALVVAMAILQLGGQYYDAMRCLKAADSDALTDFRYLAILQEFDTLMNPQPGVRRD